MITMISAKKAISVRLKTNSSDFVIRNLETGEEKEASFDAEEIKALIK